MSGPSHPPHLLQILTRSTTVTGEPPTNQSPPVTPSSLLLVHFPPPPAHGELALNSVDAVPDGGEDDEEDDDDDCDDDVALDHGCNVAGWGRELRLRFWCGGCTSGEWWAEGGDSKSIGLVGCLDRCSGLRELDRPG